MTIHERLRIPRLGCHLMLAVIVISAVLGWMVHPAFLISLGAIFCGWLFFLRMNATEKKCLHAAFNEAFAGFNGPLPELRTGTSFGFPTFELAFTSHDEARQAELGGHIPAFKRALRALYGDCGGKDNPFDPELAVDISYPFKDYRDGLTSSSASLR